MALNFSPLLTHESTHTFAKGVEMKFRYSPTLAHSEAFVDVTGDRNSFHREVYGGEAIAPAFLQNVVAILASRQAMSEVGIDRSKFARSLNDVIMDDFVVTGGDYGLFVNLRQNGSLEIFVDIEDEKGNKVFSMERDFGAVEALGNNELVHYAPFVKSNLLQFSEILGVPSSESNLCALASSSSTIFEAQDVGALPKLEDGAVGVYSRQVIYMDSSRSMGSKGIVGLEVPMKYDSPLKVGDTIETTVSLCRDEGIVYQVASCVNFVKDRLPGIAVRRALKKRKRVN